MLFRSHSICNENDMFRPFNGYKWKRIPYYDDEFRTMFRSWLNERGIEYDAEGCDLDGKDQPLMQFKMETNKKFARTMYDHIRSLGVKIPLCCTNWEKGNGLIMAQEEMDFQDGHCYYYDWSWTEYEKMTQIQRITATTDKTR